MSTSRTQARTAAGVPTGGQFAASARTESAVSLTAPAEAQPAPAPTSVTDALAPALDMNRVQAEAHVRSLIDAAAADGDPDRVDEIASLAASPGWRGVAALRSYPHATSPECGPSEFLPTKAAATRTAEYAAARVGDAERNAGLRS